jgi:two-component system C4-dicarboxylate transport response regulator DctD
MRFRTGRSRGSVPTIPLNLMCGSSRQARKNLEVEAAEGRFRSDLLYRLNVVTLRMPTLGERREDIPKLFMQLVHEACARYKRAVPDVPGGLLASLVTRSWPGNVRELRKRRRPVCARP